jgi:DNA repair protein RecO (recombination protein O)
VEWTDTAIVLGARRLGEANAVAELMTREHGRHLGLVRGGFGSRHKPVLQASNLVSATWRARIDEHLGDYVLEALDLRAATYLTTAHALYAVHHLAALCRLLPERDPHGPVFDLLNSTVAELAEPAPAAVLVARFELQLLAELGFGLDLASCAATGATEDLVYVSPNSGRAVSAAAGEPYRDRLLALPSFLRGGGAVPAAGEVMDALALTGFFLARRAFDPQGGSLPAARSRFVDALQQIVTISGG